MKKSLLALTAMAVAGCAVASSRRDYDAMARGHELRATNLGGLEASLKAVQANAKAAMSPGDGRAVFMDDKAVLGTGFLGTPALNDTIDYFVPAGTRVDDLSFVVDDCDTGTTFQVSIGYRPIATSDGPLAANTTYFAAAGAFAQAAGRIECVFKPITFQQDVWLTLTVTAAPTGVTGNPEIHMILGGQAVGTR